MLKRRPARRMWALGLLVVLCTYNLAYADVKVNENTYSLPAKIRTDKLSDDSSTNATTNDPTSKKLPSDKKKASLVKYSTKATNSCTCSCSSKTGRAAATPDAWWDCLKGCLRSWGISLVQLAICAGTCAFGIIPLCAICVGVDVSVMMLCSIGCDVYTGTTGDPRNPHEPILTRKTPGKNGRRAERRILAFAALK